MKGFLKNGGLFLLLAALTLWVIGKETDPKQILDAVTGANKLWLLAAVAASALFLCCEGRNLTRLLRASGCQAVRIGKGLHYACVGFFFSAVTPSASGGQPMQLYSMHRDGIDLANGSLALLGELLSFQLVSAALAAGGFLLQRQFLAEQLGRGQYLLLGGMGLNLTAAAFLLLLLLRPGAVRRLSGLIVKLISRFSRKQGQRAEVALGVQLAEYEGGAVQLRQSPVLIVRTLMTTLLQLTAMYGSTYLVYRAMGFGDWGFPQVMALQAVLSVSVSVLPLPGAVGVSEGVFLLLFRAVMPGKAVRVFMVLSRTVSFYLPVMATGILTAALRNTAGFPRSMAAIHGTASEKKEND